MARPRAERLAEDDGFVRTSEIERILERVARGHAQPSRPRRRCRSAARATCVERRRRGRVLLEDRRASDVLGDLRLMKRSDEGASSEKAHRRPRFVEDCVREMIARRRRRGSRSRRRAASWSARREPARRSTSTTSSPSAHGDRSASSPRRRRWRPRRRSTTTPSSGSAPAGRPRPGRDAIVTVAARRPAHAAARSPKTKSQRPAARSRATVDVDAARATHGRSP